MTITAKDVLNAKAAEDSARTAKEEAERYYFAYLRSIDGGPISKKKAHASDDELAEIERLGDAYSKACSDYSAANLVRKFVSRAFAYQVARDYVSALTSSAQLDGAPVWYKKTKRALEDILPEVDGAKVSVYASSEGIELTVRVGNSNLEDVKLYGVGWYDENGNLNTDKGWVSFERITGKQLLDAPKTFDECRRLAFDYNRRVDAISKMRDSYSDALDKITGPYRFAESIYEDMRKPAAVYV